MPDSVGVVAEQEWAASMLYGEQASAAPVPSGTPPRPDGESSAHEYDSANIGLDHPYVGAVKSAPAETLDANKRATRAAAILALMLVVAVGLIACTLRWFGATDESPAPSRAPAVAVASSPPAQVAPPAADQDHAVAFTASADCPAGSTSAQSLTDTTRDSAWVCVRGPAGAAVDGQVLHVDFGASHVFSALAVTPGWVAKTEGGQDEWLQHRVVSRLQYIFNDDDHTIVTQSTGNAHGPVTMALPRPVLASQVTVVILQTARPPTSPLPTVDPTGGDLLVPELGPGSIPSGTQTDVPAAAEQSDDPVDATFAMSTLQFFGHPPR